MDRMLYVVIHWTDSEGRGWGAHLRVCSCFPRRDNLLLPAAEYEQYAAMMGAGGAAAAAAPPALDNQQPQPPRQPQPSP